MRRPSAAEVASVTALVGRTLPESASAGAALLVAATSDPVPSGSAAVNLASVGSIDLISIGSIGSIDLASGTDLNIAGSTDVDSNERRTIAYQTAGGILETPPDGLKPSRHAGLPPADHHMPLGSFNATKRRP